MKKLKIINRSGVVIQLAELFAGIQIEETISIAPDKEHNYKCDRYFNDRSIRLVLSPEYPINRHCIFLYDDFIDANKIAYVRKGDYDRWFVDSVHRAARLVRKHVYNSTVSPIALVEYVVEQIGETRRVPGTMDDAVWTAWSENYSAFKDKTYADCGSCSCGEGKSEIFCATRRGPTIIRKH